MTGRWWTLDPVKPDIIRPVDGNTNKGGTQQPVLVVNTKEDTTYGDVSKDAGLLFETGVTIQSGLEVTYVIAKIQDRTQCGSMAYL
ncbi:hypothetical protein CHS0354_013931 [Potamilus streckersoni]|uniref:Uncharacterized protein n=1 Tax=Potamilus streckersoni TaxID=2493646 RepID=A0AAE0RXC4_9BIVA|nr:hypothetical protein CHS0354_013931 [Potamilus streckersoni]